MGPLDSRVQPVSNKRNKQTDDEPDEGASNDPSPPVGALRRSRNLCPIDETDVDELGGAQGPVESCRLRLPEVVLVGLTCGFAFVHEAFKLR